MSSYSIPNGTFFGLRTLQCTTVYLRDSFLRTFSGQLVFFEVWEHGPCDGPLLASRQIEWCTHWGWRMSFKLGRGLRHPRIPPFKVAPLRPPGLMGRYGPMGPRGPSLR